MGLDISVLVTEWEPTVAAYRAAGGLDFYWNANVARNERFYAGDRGDDLPELPYLDEWEVMGGRSSFLYPCDSWDHLRAYVPDGLRASLDTAFGAVLPGDFVDWIPDERDDLSLDAGIAGDSSGSLYYSMRPATAKAIAAIEIPWDELDRLSELHPVPEDNPDHQYLHAGAIQWAAGTHLRAVAEAAALGRGVIGILSH